MSIFLDLNILYTNLFLHLKVFSVPFFFFILLLLILFPGKMKVFLFTLAILLSHAFGVLQILGPDSSSEFTASNGKITIPLKWDDDTTLPSLSDVDSMTFVLCTGPSGKIKALDTIKAISMSDLGSGSYNAEFDASVASDGLFYVQIYAPLTGGNGKIIQYTPRIILNGMTGSYEPTGNGPPPPGQVNANDDSLISKSFAVPYTEQTGRIRYAPMQMQPGSTVTAKTWSRRFPTSAVTYYKSAAGQPIVKSTITPGWSYTMSSLVNMATPAPFPSEIGWYPASKRLVSATLDGNHQHQRKKRWADS